MATVALLAIAIAACGNATQPTLVGATTQSSADAEPRTTIRPVTTVKEQPSKPIAPSSEVMAPGDIVVPTYDPKQGEGTPILCADALTQPLCLDGIPADDLSKTPFKLQPASSLPTPTRIVALTDYSVVAYVYEKTDFGSLIIKEVANPDQVDFDAIVKEVDDPATPERSGIDERSGHEYIGISDPSVGLILVDVVNQSATVYVNLPDSVTATVSGVGDSLTRDLAIKLAASLKFG